MFKSVFDLLAYIRRKITAVYLRSFIYFRRLLFRPRARHYEGRKSIQIPSRDRGRSIAAHLYYPPGQLPSPSAPLKRSPILINWHGSGFVFPLFGSDAAYCAQISRARNIVVLDADYRKSPEHPFPAAVHDAEDVISWVLRQEEQFDAQRVALSGFSAGANLALVAASCLTPSFQQRFSAFPAFQAVIAFYPPCDLNMAPEKKQAPKPLNPISPWLARFFNDCYLPGCADRRDPRASPKYADAAAFPMNVVVVTCEGDHLCLEAEELAHRLDDGSRSVKKVRVDGVGHAWDKSAQEGTEAGRKRDEAYRFVEEALHEALDI